PQRRERAGARRRLLPERPRHGHVRRGLPAAPAARVRLLTAHETRPKMNIQPLLRLLAAGLAGALAAQTLRELHRPYRLSLGGFAADAPRWLAELNERNDD